MKIILADNWGDEDTIVMEGNDRYDSDTDEYILHPERDAAELPTVAFLQNEKHEDICEVYLQSAYRDNIHYELTVIYRKLDKENYSNF